MTHVSQLELPPMDYEISAETGEVSKFKGAKKAIRAATEKVFERDGAWCKRCHKQDRLTLDHIIPISIVVMFGFARAETYADIENLQVLCRGCNTFKGNRLDFSNPKTKELLLKYLSLV